MNAAEGIASLIAGELGPERILYGAAIWSMFLGQVWSWRSIEKLTLGEPIETARGRVPLAWLCVSLAAVIFVAVGIFSALFLFLSYLISNILREGTQSEIWGYSKKGEAPLSESRKADSRDEANGQAFLSSVNSV